MPHGRYRQTTYLLRNAMPTLETPSTNGTPTTNGTATPSPPKDGAVIQIQELGTRSKKHSLWIIFGEGQESIISVIADVAGQSWTICKTLQEADTAMEGMVVGLERTAVDKRLAKRDQSCVVVNAHCYDSGQGPDEALREYCDYEYLYTQTPFFRRDVARFFSVILGQIDPHRDLAKKTRTNLLCMTFPDVHAALPNLDILSVGADAVELRVDLLKEPLPDGSFASLPSFKYVGEQLLTLRQRTELPIIFTTRCTKENGKFPMEDPNLFYNYLSKAIQWGCEYIDVELWLPVEIRRQLASQKGHSRIISAFHDFSGNFKWAGPETEELFRKGAEYADIVKMNVLVHTMQDNYELEYFRNTIQAKYPHPPLSALNMSKMGQLSRTLNKVFTPITHPLLPIIAAPGQLSAAEINAALHSMGQFPKVDIYGVGSYRSATQAMFFEKCFNELSLPHQFNFVERGPKGAVDAIMRRPNFGGAYINPPIAASAPYLPSLSQSAKTIGQVDTIVVGTGGGQTTFMGENATWKGIRATLTRDFVPSAYSGRAALVLSSSESDAAAGLFALRSLDIGPIYTIGFKTRGHFASDVEPVRSVDDMKRLAQPFVIISALPAEKSLLVGPLLKHYSVDGRSRDKLAGKVFVDLALGPRKGDSLALASSLGWTAYGVADVSAWTTVETMRLLVGQNVPYDFVRLASGTVLY